MSDAGIDLSTLFWLPKAPADFAARLESALASSRPGSQLRGLASHRLNSSHLRKIKGALERLGDRHEIDTLRRVRLGVLSNVTMDFAADLLPGTGPRHGLALEVGLGPYGAVASALLGPSNVFEKDIDALLLVLDDGMFWTQSSLLDGERHNAAIDHAADLISRFLAAARDRYGCPVVLATMVPDPLEAIASSDAHTPGSYLSFVAELNDRIRRLASAGECVLLDIASLAASVGIWRWADPIARHVAKSPFAIQLGPMLADAICATLAGIFGKSRRALILDLDNTIWGGVIGDDGIEGISVGQGSASGESHLAVQRLALNLRDRGVVLAVCSKNNDNVAREPFRSHPDMLLREEHIAVFQANWNDKATNIASIAQTLNLGLDAFVFLDDNPAERTRVRQELPEVAVPELPEDPAWFALCLAAARYFETPRLSKDDLLRAQSYRDNAKRAEIKSAVGNYVDYLKSLKMRLIVKKFDDIGRERIVQLINKSNQFNLTTRRRNELEVSAVQSASDMCGLQFRLEDTFGDSGMISVVVLKNQRDHVYIDTWLMSCRVLERGVEEAVLNEIVAKARNFGARYVLGEFIPTSRNEMVATHYKKMGFSKAVNEPWLPEGANERDYWILDTKRYEDSIVQMEIVTS